jgi:2-polyprenyl-6-methoxyphenol hydroxylase-like FAD-dependent oxidoreductase
VRERFAVEEIVIEDGVVRVRGREKGGVAVTETARFVVGADGKHSAVARAARAAEYRTEAARSLACYTYWEGVEMDGGEMYGLGRRSVGAWPTNDGLVMTLSRGRARSSKRSAATSRGTSWPRWTSRARSGSACAPDGGPNGSGPPPTCPTSSGCPTVTAGPWSVTPDS